MVEMGTERAGQQREELLTLSRRERQLWMDPGGEGAQYAFACGRLHGLVLVLASLAVPDTVVE
jgi:hypothetical protein